jgi:HK97 family phage prohead protease
MKTICKLLDTEVEASDELREVTVICSTESVDRIGDVVVQNGIDLRNFQKNPVVLWGHDSDRPVARATSIGVINGKLQATVQFPSPGEDPDADWVYGKVKNRLVNAVSIGFLPREWEPVDPKEPWDGYRFTESELCEFSFVSVPMNAEALIVGRSILPPKRREFTPPSRREAEGGWKVGAARDLPIDDSDSWDGPAASKRMFDAVNMDGDKPDLEPVRRGFLIYDASKPELKGSYKLPFADIVAGQLKAVRGGVRAAASRLRQIDAPSEVLDRAEAVLNHYKKKFDMGDQADEGDDEGKTLDIAFATIARALKEARAKAGRKLSRENEDHLRKATEHIKTVLDAAGGTGQTDPNTDPEGEDPDIPSDEPDKQARGLRAKEGRKLSAENEAHLREAHKCIKAVLDSIDGTTDDPQEDVTVVNDPDEPSSEASDDRSAQGAVVKQFPRRTALELALMKLRAGMVA